MATLLVDRRAFLKVSLLAGGGLMLAYDFEDAAVQADGVFAPNPFIKISPENGIVIDPAPTDPAAIEVYVALHSWLEQQTGTQLNVKIDGRAYTMRDSDAEGGRSKPIDIRAGRRHAVRA